MPTNYNGNLTGIAAREQVIISEPAGTDVRNAASVRTPLEKIANLLQYLMQRSGLLDQVQTWLAKQNLQAPATDQTVLDLLRGHVALTEAALQQIKKSGGKLQAGTSTDHDLEFLRAGAVALALTADGLDAKNRAVLNIARLLLQQLEADPATPADGDVWERAGKIYARLAGVTQALATESMITGVTYGTSGIVWSQNFEDFNTTNLFKIGRMVVLSADARCLAGSSTYTQVIMNLPVGFRPLKRAVVCALDYPNSPQGALVLLSDSGGTVSFQSSTTVTNHHYYFSATYISDS